MPRWPTLTCLAALAALAACDPFVLYGPVHGEHTERTIIINGGTESGAWKDPGTSQPESPTTPAAPSPNASQPNASQPSTTAPTAPAPPADPTPAPTPSAPSCGSALESEVLSLVNTVRGQHGRAPLSCEPGAAQVARAYSERMCDEGFFSHFGPHGSTPWSRLEAAGIFFHGAGENIAAGMSTAQEVMATWMDSPAHRDNILGDYTHLGVGHAPCYGGGMPHLWTQSFLKR